MKTVEVALSPDDLMLLCNSINLALDKIEDWEFETLIGESPEQARALWERLNRALGTTAR